MKKKEKEIDQKSGSFSRRGFLKGAGITAAGTVIASSGVLSLKGQNIDSDKSHRLFPNATRTKNPPRFYTAIFLKNLFFCLQLFYPKFCQALFEATDEILYPRPL